jgi:hypothetical protein
LESCIRCGAICLIALLVVLFDQESNQERGASKQLAPQCGASCLLALFVALSNQERGASKQLAPGVPYAYLPTDLLRFANACTVRQAVRYGEHAASPYTKSRTEIIVAQGFRHTTPPSSCPCNNPAVFYQGVLWRSAEPCVAWRRHIYPKSPTVSGGLFCRPRAATLQWPCELSRGRR